MVKLVQKRPTGKAKKPYPTFPLFPHATHRWCKKIGGQFSYFGSTLTDPTGEAALRTYKEFLAGRDPRRKAKEGATVRDVANAFLSSKKRLLESSELTQRSFDEYFATAERLIKAFGRLRSVDDLVADDFARLRTQIAKQWGPIRLANEIQRVRSIFKHGFDAGLLDTPIRFGTDFKKPSAKTLRQNRAKGGVKLFEPDELLAILKVAGPNMKAMLLLAINGGLGNADVAGLAFSNVNLKTGWLTYPRPKTGIERRIPLWPETVEAIKTAIAERHTPKDSADKTLVFIGPRGESYVSANGYRVAGEFTRALTAAKVNRKGLSFYALRHTFQTIGEGACDLAAVQAIMGHAASGSDMSARYRERVDDDRLLAVTEHVRKWLFGEQK